MDPKNNPGMIAQTQGDGVSVLTNGNTGEKGTDREINIHVSPPGVIQSEAKEYRKVRHWNMPAMDMDGRNREVLLEEIVARLRTIEEVLLRLEQSLRPAGTASPPAGDNSKGAD